MKVLIYNAPFGHIMGKDAQRYVDERIATQPAYRQTGDDAIKYQCWYKKGSTFYC
jgi:hypothetical protein